MTRDQLLALSKGEPFHPFELNTTSGQVYTFTHPEQYWVAPEGEPVLVYLTNRIAFIDFNYITEFVRLVKPVKSKTSN